MKYFQSPAVVFGGSGGWCPVGKRGLNASLDHVDGDCGKFQKYASATANFSRLKSYLNESVRGRNMRVHYFQHVPFETLGFIERWLQARSHVMTVTRFYEPQYSLPNLNDLDWLIVMGGPMGVDDEEQYPWLKDEKEFVQKAIVAGKRVLGICLGAQLIATVLGASVFRNQFKEIGWFPVRRAEAAESAPVFRFPEKFDAFHWHGDTFDLPPNAVRLAQSEACLNQAFQWERTVIALQFHLEVTPASVQALVEHCRAELSPAPFVQSEADILKASAEQFQTANQLMADVLTYLESA